MVKVFDTNFREVVASPPLDGLTWQAADPLSRGEIYIWQVTAIRRGEEINSPVPPAPEARFRVLTQDRAALLAQVEKQLTEIRTLLWAFFMLKAACCKTLSASSNCS